jgi:hypothetical protein
VMRAFREAPGRPDVHVLVENGELRSTE